MELLILSGAHLMPAWRGWEAEMVEWCQQRDYSTRTLHPPGLIKDAAYQASQGVEVEENLLTIGRWQRDQVLGASAVLLASDPRPDAGLAMLAGWAAANGRPLVLYHSDPRATGEWGRPLDASLTSMAVASGGGVATGLEELHNLLARCAALTGESRLMTTPRSGTATLRDPDDPDKPVITFD